MGKRKASLLVLLSRSNQSNQEIETKVLNISTATKKLAKEKLYLIIDSVKKSWTIECNDGNPFYFKCQIGRSHDFNVDRGFVTSYSIGVYDRKKISHLQDVIDSVKYQESMRHPSIDAD